MFVSLLHISADPDKPFSDRLSPSLSYFELFYYPLYLSRRDVPLVKFDEFVKSRKCSLSLDGRGQG